MSKALLIIDVQNDYFPKGRNELFQPEKALDATKKLLKSFREDGSPVYYIQHVKAKGATFFESGTEGVKIHEDIQPKDSEKVIIKHQPSSFLETNLQEELQKDAIDELVVCGMMTHMCVDTTVRVAKELGYSVTLISDACTTFDLEWNHERIAAEVVQKVYLASLHPYFADVKTCEEYFCNII